MVDQLSGGVGLVLSGAVAQGGFEAGALSALSRRKPRILGVAATSSGALNATLAAAGAATGQLELATDVLKKLWIEDGSWQHIADVPISDWLHLRGAFDTKRLQALVVDGLREVLSGWKGRPTAPVTLTLVTTNLNTGQGPDPAVPLPTYEQAIHFSAEQIVDPSQWARIANAAAASASLPLLFSPTSFDAAPCIDGGVVNNAPISYVLRDPNVDTVVVVATESPTKAKVASLAWPAVGGRIASALINERIAHDLGVAHKANARYRAIVAALDADPAVSEETRKRVLLATGRRLIKLYLVQPESPLPGDAFSGFFHRDQRTAYVEAGEGAPMTSIGD
jgi:predicted acylesterase/phospholipase RssA